MTRAALLALAVAACTPAEWTRTDTAAQLAVTASLAVDYQQTRQALDEGAVESNPVMGESGERVAPEVYFPAVAVIALTGAVALPRPWRGILQGGLFTVQTKVITGNWVRFGRVW